MLSLKSSVFFSRFEGGVVFRGSDTPVVFRGKRAYELAQMLLAQMARGAAPADVVAALPEAVRPAAEQFLASLVENNLLRTRDDDDPKPETQLAPRFANLWNYLADNHRRPGSVLEDWSKVTVYVEGGEDACAYAARALAECAVRHIVLAPATPAAEEEAGAAAHARALERLRREFDGLRIERLDRAANGHVPPGSIKIRAVGDDPIATADTTLADAWFFGGLAGRLVVSYVTGRLSEVLPQWERAMRQAASDEIYGRLPPARIGVAASAVAFGAFNEFCGITQGPSVARPHIVDAASQLVPVSLPGALHVQADPVSAPRAEPAAPTKDDERLAAVQPLFDPVSGILAYVDNDLRQIPLSVIQVRAGSSRDGASAHVVTGWGSTDVEARLRAARRGVAAYLRSQPDVRERAAGLGVAWTPELARAAASARATAAAHHGAAAAWQPLHLHAGFPPDVRKLAKLIALLNATEPELFVATSADPPAVSVKVHVDRRQIALASAPDLATAAYEALGDACVVLQLPEAGIDEAAAADGAAPRIDTAAAQPRFSRIELGYPGVGEVLHCWMLERDPA